MINVDSLVPDPPDEDLSPPIRCELVPPYTEHDPCGMPGCGRSQTGKWAAVIWKMEVRPLSRNWGGLETAAYPLVICERCHAFMGDYAMDTLMSEEEKRRG